MKQAVLERYEDAFLTCGPNGLQSKTSDILKAVCVEFNDLQSIDKIANVQVRLLAHITCFGHNFATFDICLPLSYLQAKVDSVTGIMRNNIQMALKNTDR